MTTNNKDDAQTENADAGKTLPDSALDEVAGGVASPGGRGPARPGGPGGKTTNPRTTRSTER
jgi:hypothetical protein